MVVAWGFNRWINQALRNEAGGEVRRFSCVSQRAGDLTLY
jgi:hypothetical protein